MAKDQKVTLEFGLSDGSKKPVSFTVPGGKDGADGAAGETGEAGKDGVSITSVTVTQEDA